MSNGIPMLGTITQKCKVDKISNYEFKIVLTQGLNRQIRRMCEYLNYSVKKLERTRIMNVNLKGLAYGEWRELSISEVNDLNQLIASSSKTAEVSEDKNKNRKFGRERNNYKRNKRKS
jgi:23S rRNA pseudouridine2604 synthase